MSYEMSDLSKGCGRGRGLKVKMKKYENYEKNMNEVSNDV